MSEGYNEKWFALLYGRVAGINASVPEYWDGDDDPADVKDIKARLQRLKDDSWDLAMILFKKANLP
jgi:hypothetical protein